MIQLTIYMGQAVKEQHNYQLNQPRASYLGFIKSTTDITILVNPVTGNLHPVHDKAERDASISIITVTGSKVTTIRLLLKYSNYHQYSWISIRNLFPTTFK